MKPIGARILVKELEDPGNELWIPASSSAHATRRGVVLELGADCEYVEQGDEILFPPEGMAVIEFRRHDERLYVMPEGAALLVLDRIG